MLNSLELEKRKSSTVELGKEGNKNRENQFLYLTFPPERPRGFMALEEWVHGGMVEDHRRKSSYCETFLDSLWPRVLRIPDMIESAVQVWGKNTKPKPL